MERQRKAAENGNEEEEEEEDDDDDRPSSSSSFAAATVFVTEFPPDWLNEFTIRDLFSTSFGETKRVQLIRLETNSDAKQRFGDVRTDQVFAEALEEYRRKKNHRSTDNKCNSRQ